MLRLLALILLSTMPHCLAAEWKAGVGRESITPPNSMPMAGYASRGSTHATGKLHELWAKSLMLEDASGNRCVLVTLDLCGIDAVLADRVCAQLKQALDLERPQIMLAASHTHSGPVVAGNLRPMHYMMFSDADRKLVDDYASFLVEKISSCVEQAARDLKHEYREGRTGASSGKQVGWSVRLQCSGFTGQASQKADRCCVWLRLSLHDPARYGLEWRLRRLCTGRAGIGFAGMQCHVLGRLRRGSEPVASPNG
jgi:hypothetical protein